MTHAGGVTDFDIPEDPDRARSTAHGYTPPVRDYEVILLVFGGMAGVTWALVALFVYNVAGDGLPLVADYTVLLPLAAAFLIGARFHLPLDVLSLTFVIGATCGLLAAGGCVLYLRLRGG